MLKKMLNTVKFKINNIILVWVISYIIIFSIPTVSNFFIYQRALDSAKNETIQSYSRTLDAMIAKSDQIMESASAFRVNMSINDSLSNLLETNDPQDPKTKELYFRLASDMITHYIYMPFSSTYIYLSHLDSVVAPNYAGAAPHFFEIVFKDTQGFPYEEWHTVMNRQNYASYVLYEKGGKDYVEFFYQLPKVPSAYVEATLAMCLERDRLIDKSAFENDAADIGLVIIDPQEQIIYSSLPEEGFPIQPYHHYDGISSIEEKGYTTICETSDTTQWRYLAIIPKAVFSEKVKYIHAGNTTSILLALLISGLLAIYFAFRNYKPLKLLTEKCKSIVEGAPKASAYETLDSLLTSYSENQQNFRKVQLEKQHHEKNRIFRKWLKTGEYPEELELISDYFAVIVFQIHHMDRLFSTEEISDQERYENCFFILQNIMEEFFGLQDNGYVAEVDEQFIAVFNCADEEGAATYKLRLQKMLSDGCRFVEQHFGFSFSAGISTMQLSGHGVPVAYNEAICALKFKKDIREGATVFYDEMKSESTFSDEEAAQRFWDCEQRLAQIIAIGDEKTAKLLLETMVESCTAISNVEIAKTLMFGLANTILKALPPEFANRWDYGEIVNSVNQFINLNNPSESFYEIMPILERVCRLRNEELEEISVDLPGSEPTKGTLAAKIADYIRMRYTDENLNVANIGEHFHISPYYASKVFKKVTDENILDYIGRIRVEKAKELMCSSNLTMEEIMDYVGFSNMKTFARIFSKFEGSTPSKYKKQHNEK